LGDLGAAHLFWLDWRFKHGDRLLGFCDAFWRDQSHSDSKCHLILLRCRREFFLKQNDYVSIVQSLAKDGQKYRDVRPSNGWHDNRVNNCHSRIRPIR